MSQHNAIYYPYGAYELKAKYQRNLAFGTLSVLTLVLLTLGVSWGIANWTDTPVVILTLPVETETTIDIGPPISIVRPPIEVEFGQPPEVSGRIGIPTPVPDEEILDDNVVLATQDEMAVIVGPDITERLGEGGNFVVEIPTEDYIPAQTEFVIMEIYPEMIDHAEPEYPRLAKAAGLEGRVTVQVLVDKNGQVRDCTIARSSGSDLLDEAACKAGKKCKFSPGIQNGDPVFCWVSFNYDFRLADR